MTLDDLGGQTFADVPQTADILGLDPRTVRRGAEAGEIPAHKIGNKWLIPTSWLRERAGMPVAQPPAAPDPDQFAELVVDRVLARLAELFGGTDKAA